MPANESRRRVRSTSHVCDAEVPRVLQTSAGADAPEPATHASIAAGKGRGHAFVQMGGRSLADQDHLVTEVPIRTFWKGYCELIGMDAAQ